MKLIKSTAEVFGDSEYLFRT